MNTLRRILLLISAALCIHCAESPTVFAQDQIDGGLGQAANTPKATQGFGNFEVGLPGLNDGENDDKSIDKFVQRDTPFLDFMNAAIIFIIAVIIILAVITIVVAGYVYMTAGGDSSRVTFAKELITAALTGIILSTIAWLILNTISPQFTTGLKDPKELLQQNQQQP